MRRPWTKTNSVMPRWWWSGLLVVWMMVFRAGEASIHSLDDPEAFDDFEDVAMEHAASAAEVQQETPLPPGDNTKVGPPPPRRMSIDRWPIGRGSVGGPGVAAAASPA